MVQDVAPFFDSRRRQLTTTPAHEQFLRAHPNIEWDNGTMVRLEATAAVRALAKEYRVRLAWSPRHVIHPYRLRVFAPDGHPLAAQARSELARSDRDDALWAFSLWASSGTDRAVVWQLTKRELLRAVFRGLAARGYDERGRHREDGRELRGTLGLTVLDAKHARRLPLDRFGEAVADTLDKHYATWRETNREAEAVPENGTDLWTRSTERNRIAPVEAQTEDRQPSQTSWRPRQRKAQTEDREPSQTSWRPRQRK